MNILNIKLKNKIGAFEISSDGGLIINQQSHSAIPGYDLHPIFYILQSLESSFNYFTNFYKYLYFLMHSSL